MLKYEGRCCLLSQESYVWLDVCVTPLSMLSPHNDFHGLDMSSDVGNFAYWWIFHGCGFLKWHTCCDGHWFDVDVLGYEKEMLAVWWATGLYWCCFVITFIALSSAELYRLPINRGDNSLISNWIVQSLRRYVYISFIVMWYNAHVFLLLSLVLITRDDKSVHPAAAYWASWSI